MIFGKKDAYNNVRWRKPVEILKDHDEDGIRNILNTIGQKRVLEFMRREGIGLKGEPQSPRMSSSARATRVEEEKLIALFERYASGLDDDFFPFSAGEFAIEKGPRGSSLRGRSDRPRTPAGTAEEEWMMPNLANFPIRSAIEKLSAHTSRIRIVGGRAGDVPDPRGPSKG